jgi:hypothetical protein
MDVYCHPFTSGGQEIPIQEAKLTELITLVTNYSCGEDSCSSESGGFALDWAEYREPGTQFIKASTLPTSINEKLKMVYEMAFDEKVLLGKKSRNYVINKYSIEIVGKYFENLFDSFPEVEFDYEKADMTPNAYFEPDNSLNDKEWIESLYENLLKRKDSSGVIHWMQRLKTDLKRQDVLTYFRKVALSEIQKAEFEKMLKILNEDKSLKKIAYIQPDGAEEVLIATSILPSIQKVYPDHKIYFFTKSENFDLINSHPNVYKTLSYFNKLDDPLYLEGKGNLNKYFDIVFAPYLSIRNNYFRNAQDILEYQTT